MKWPSMGYLTLLIQGDWAEHITLSIPRASFSRVASCERQWGKHVISTPDPLR